MHGDRAVLGLQHPGAEGLGRVAVEHRHRRLRDDRPAVDLRAHDMHRAPRAIFTPAARARACVLRPVKAGSSEGWMFSMRSRQRSTKPGVIIRMKPAQAMRSTSNSSERCVELRLEAFARAETLVVDGDASAGPRPHALNSPCASGRLEMTHDDLGRVSGVARGRDQRHHVGAASRDQDGERFFVWLMPGPLARGRVTDDCLGLRSSRWRQAAWRTSVRTSPMRSRGSQNRGSPRMQ